jgi:hypothetical protein
VMGEKWSSVTPSLSCKISASQHCLVTFPVHFAGGGIVMVVAGGGEEVQGKKVVGVAVAVRVKAVEVEVTALSNHRQWQL